ncbi:MAG: DUF2683 family protein [Candidatus Micrarchaeota archaeon]
MVQAMIQIDEHTNKILNLVKINYDLRNKSEAIEVLVKKYENDDMEPEFKPEYIKKLDRIEKHGKFTRVTDLKKFFDEL